MSLLKKQLKQLLDAARRSAGLPQRRTVDDLTLQITQEPGGDVVLVLECRNRWASVYDLNDIFKHWPEPLPTPRPLPAFRKEGKIHRLIARWPRPLNPLPEGRGDGGEGESQTAESAA
jgi:hypothetical protein